MKTIQTAALAAAVALAPLMASSSGALAVDKSAVLTTYADIAHAAYGDSLSTAETLLQAVDKLLADPGDETLAAARQAWVAARAPYQQTEAYRFGNAIVDDRSEEHTSELQSLMRISYAVFCLKKNNTTHISRSADSVYTSK